MTNYDPRAQKKEPEDPFDLEERLANYRSRVAREGRQAALERLDRAIDKARRTPKRSK